MDILRNLFGSVTSGIVRLLVTVGILAAVYFFIVKPVLDTTETISSETNESIQKSFENKRFDEIEVTLENVNRRVERQLHAVTEGVEGTGGRRQAAALHGEGDRANVNRVQRCAKRYGAG